jgi:hypothetical protein
VINVSAKPWGEQVRFQYDDDNDDDDDDPLYTKRTSWIL